MTRAAHVPYLLFIALSVAILAGCGRSGPELATVSGTVTLDGKPLPKARLEFQPVGIGSPSYATTDAKGHYELTYALDRPGAMLGKQTVRITTFRQLPGGGEIPERVPAEYNSETTLEREIASGHNKFDFPLTGALRP